MKVKISAKISIELYDMDIDECYPDRLYKTEQDIINAEKDNLMENLIMFVENNDLKDEDITIELVLSDEEKETLKKRQEEMKDVSNRR